MAHDTWLLALSDCIADPADVAAQIGAVAKVAVAKVAAGVQWRVLWRLDEGSEQTSGYQDDYFLARAAECGACKALNHAEFWRAAIV